jgi:hypothetical protein
MASPFQKGPSLTAEVPDTLGNDLGVIHIKNGSRRSEESLLLGASIKCAGLCVIFSPFLLLLFFQNKWNKYRIIDFLSQARLSPLSETS